MVGAHVRPLVQLRAVQNVPQHVHRGVRLDGHAGLHAFLVNILDQLARAGARGSGFVGGVGRGDGGDGRLVVEAVQIAAGLFELVDPFVRLRSSISDNSGEIRELGECSATHLHDHHVAVKGAPATGLEGAVDATANL